MARKAKSASNRATANRREVLKTGAKVSAAIATLGLSVGVDFSTAMAADPKAKAAKRAKGVRATQIKKSKRTTVRQIKSRGSAASQSKVEKSGARQIKLGRTRATTEKSNGIRARQDKALRTGTTSDKISPKR